VTVAVAAARIGRARQVRGDLRVPGDKSLSHRALLFNALSSGVARIDGIGWGEDVRSTRRCVEALGIVVQDDSNGATFVHGVGPRGLREPIQILDCGNSGTTMRLLLGILAGQDGLFGVLDGDGSLRARPMARVLQPLTAMGAVALGRHGNTLAPVALRGASLRRIDHVSSVASAQVKSAVLLAGLQADGETSIAEPIKSRDHSELMLAAMGADIRVVGTSVWVSGPTDSLRPLSLRVPGDFSSAAFWLVLACVHPDARIVVRGVGVNPTRTGLLDVLAEMGARVVRQNERVEGGEPVADLLAESSELRAVDIGGDLIPRLVDEVPALTVAACFAAGETRIRDAAELRNKESDRLAATARELGALGAQVTETEDGLRVQGGRALTAGATNSHHDHRLAMAAAIAASAGAGGTVDRYEAASVSYPDFWSDLRAVGAEVELPR
jgi:3-phosphoshikimate 1-carboxyvinyltransferase